MNNFNEDTFVPDKNTDWYYILQSQILSEKFIEKFKDKLDWINISISQTLSEKFIEKYKNKVNWNYISIYQTLSENFIEKFQDKVNWNLISNKVNWNLISKYQTLSEKFIEKYKNKVDWDYISQSQILSEKFIEKYQDKVKWYYISIYQKLSEQFIEKHKDKVVWNNISIYQKLSKEFIKKYNLKISENCWLYKTKEEKLNYIKQNTNYEIIDNNYIIAYKSVRNDYKSILFPSKYQYEIGKTYESNCDCNVNEENSFGLSAWTKQGALDYYYGKLLLVKINIEDIGAIVKNNNKIRCFKLLIVLKEIN